VQALELAEEDLHGLRVGQLRRVGGAEPIGEHRELVGGVDNDSHSGSSVESLAKGEVPGSSIANRCSQVKVGSEIASAAVRRTPG